MKHLWLMIFFALALCQNSFAANLVSTVDRQKISEDETLSLKITLDDASFSGSPDLAGIDSNFQIVNQRSSSNTTIINGNYSSKKEWFYTLLPKKTGKLLIPSFKLKNVFSDAIEIEVLSSDEASKNKAGNETDVTAASDLFLEQSIDKTEAYVQEPLTLTLRIFTAIQIARPEMPTPSLSGFMVEKLGQAEYQSKRNNRDYYVLEYKYMLFPNKSGTSEWPRQRYQIAQIINNGPRAMFNIPEFNQPNTQARFLSTPAITLDIKPQPDKLPAPYWLPSKKIEITDNWPAEQRVEVGTALTRSIIIKAQGNLAAHIPPLPSDTLPGLKLYAEQAELNNTHSDDNVTGTRKQNIAIVPAQPGTYVLPAISLHWWDTQNKQLKVATLPERTLVVTAAATTHSPTVSATPMTFQNPGAADSAKINRLPATRDEPPFYMNVSVWMGAAAFFIILWLATLFVLLRNKNSSSSANSELPAADASRQASLKNVLKQLKVACISNDARLARSMLVRWAQLQWPDANIQTLQQLKQQLQNDDLGKLIDKLDASLYGDAEQWNGKPLLSSLSRTKREKHENNDATLPKLYE